MPGEADRSISVPGTSVFAVDDEVSLDLMEAGFGSGWNPDVIVGGLSEAGEEVIVSLPSRFTSVGADAEAASFPNVEWSGLTLDPTSAVRDRFDALELDLPNPDPFSLSPI